MEKVFKSPAMLKGVPLGTAVPFDNLDDSIVQDIFDNYVSPYSLRASKGSTLGFTFKVLRRLILAKRIRAVVLETTTGNVKQQCLIDRQSLQEWLNTKEGRVFQKLRREEGTYKSGLWLAEELGY